MPERMYRRIADDLRSKIESGELGPGTQLPTEMELRERYAASRNTVRDAMKWLISCGLVETRTGQAAFVAGRIDPHVTVLTGDPGAGSDDEGPAYLAEVEATLRNPAATGPRVEIRQACGGIRSELRLPEGSIVVSRRQQRSIDGIPWSLQTSFYPMRLVERGALKLIQEPGIEEGTAVYLGTTLGITQAGYHDVLTARAPTQTEAAFFGLPDDGRMAVLEVRRTAFDSDGHPFRLTITVYPADRNHFEVDVGSVPSPALSALGNGSLAAAAHTTAGS